MLHPAVRYRYSSKGGQIPEGRMGEKKKKRPLNGDQAYFCSDLTRHCHDVTFLTDREIFPGPDRGSMTKTCTSHSRELFFLDCSELA